MKESQAQSHDEHVGNTRYDITYIPLGSAGWGGAERSLLGLAGRLSKEGKRVLILAERALISTPFGDEAEKLNLDLRWVDWAPDHSLWKNLRSAIKTFRHLDTNIMHFNISWRRGMCFIPLCARVLTSAKLVGSMRAMPDVSNLIPRKRYLMGMIPGIQLWRVPDLLRGRVWARTMHATVSVNHDDYPPRLVSEYGFKPDRLEVIYNGVDIPTHLPTIEEMISVRERFGIDPKDFLVCFLGRLSPEKGVNYLLEALPGCPGHVRLLVIGEGPDEQRLKDLCQELGITERVIFAGFHAQPEPIVAACNLAAVPSTWNEAFGRTVVEAMAAQVPVVASRTGGMAELFVDREHGLYVTPGDSAELREALTQLALNPAHTHEMGIEGRKWVRERYSMERVAQAYSGLYETLLPS